MLLRSTLVVLTAALVLVAVQPTSRALAGEPADDGAAGAGPPEVTTRFAVHDRFDRLVLSLPEGAEPVSHQVGAVLFVQLPGAGEIEGNGVSGRRLLAVQDGEGHVQVQVAPGARVRVWRLADHLVIDVFDPLVPRPSSPVPPARRAVVAQALPHGGRQAAPSSSTSGSGAAASPSAVMGRVASASDQQKPKSEVAAYASQTRSGGLPAQPAPPAGMSTAAPSQPAVSSSPTVSSEPTVAPAQGAAVTLLGRSGAMPGPAILLPLGRGSGGAVFARAGEGHAVFDVPQPLDLGALKDDVNFGSVTEQMLADGVHLKLRLPPSAQLRLYSRDDGWVLAIVQAPDLPALSSITGHLHAGALTLAAASPGRIVVLDDETTGGRLLVGTQLAAGQRVASAHVGVEFNLLPTWQGVVVAPASDRVQVRRVSNGFELSAAQPPELAADWSERATGSWPDGRIMTRLFDFPELPTESLHRRLGQALRDAAMTPKPARYGPRRAVAQAMLALGMDVEAASVLHVASADDPGHADDPVAKGLTAIATWLSAKAGGAAPPEPGVDLASLGTSDEALLWRALLPPGVADQVRQASALATTWPMVLAYPANLRRQMVRPVAEALRNGGQAKALAALLAACSDPALDLTRAAVLQDQGRIDEALTLLDRIAARPDRLARAQALQQAVEWRLAAHRLEPAAAATLLDHQIYAWRGGQRELDLRLRVAQLRAQTGAWRMALSLLRETDVQFPVAHPQIRIVEKGIVADLLHGKQAARLSAFDLATLADEDADLLTQADVDADLTPLLADKLMALDLPRRAEPIVRRLFETADDPSAKAELGLRLAALLEERGDAAGALAALGPAEAGGSPPALAARGRLASARLLLSLGKPGDALASLGGQQGPEATEMRVTILEKQGDWRSAAQALAPGLQDPGFVALPESIQRKAILRLARDESQAGDRSGLHRLRDGQHARFASGEGAELFAILTADPVENAADLPRAARELSAIRALPTRLANAQPF